MRFDGDERCRIVWATRDDRNNGHDPAEGRAAMRRTAEVIRSAGFDVDPEFWPINGAADCTQSYAGCSDSPVAK